MRYQALLLFCSIMPLAHAAPVDCKLARTPRAKAVCANPALLALDRQVADVYERLQVQLSPEGAAAVASDQKSWLAWLDQVCSGDARSSACLSNEYRHRLDQLNAGTTPGSSVTIYTRAHFALARDPVGKPSDSMDPGYTRADAAWPQIDRPTAQQLLWNQRVQAFIVQLVDGSMPRMIDPIQKQIDAAKVAPFPASLNGILLGWDDSSLGYSVDAANETLVSITFHLSTDNYGAAHGGDNPATFTWWLDRGSELKPADIFGDGNGWKASLTRLAIAKLKTDAALRGSLWKNDEFQQNVMAAVGRTDAWTVTNVGLTITFGEYEVAGYSSGEPAASFTWQELHSLLAPSFNPDRLPPPSSRQP